MANDSPVVQKGRPGSAVENTRGSQYFVPAVDIYETEEELLLFADIPGVSSDNINLHFENGELILEGRVPQRQRPGKALSLEYEEGGYYRVFQVHESIDTSRIAAECKNGVLRVHLPKEEKVKPRKVAVKGA